MTGRSRLAIILLLLSAQAGHAQTSVSASAALQSEYRFRGESLSDGRAVPQASVNLDNAAGWYLGGFASGFKLGDLRGAQLLAYAGYAQRLVGGWSWEAGCKQTTFTQWHIADYGECYAGAAADNLSMRLYYAPHYFGRDVRTVYGEINGFYALHPRLNLVGHAGLLRTLSGMPGPGLPADSRYDTSLGLSVPLGDWTAQLTRVQTQPDDTPYPRYTPRPPKAWVFSATYTF